MKAGWSFEPKDIDHDCPVIRRTRQIQLADGENIQNQQLSSHSYKLRTTASIQVPHGMMDHLPSNPNPPGGESIYGWLEMPPLVTRKAEGVYVISEEWHYKLLPVAIYGQPI